jgi:hypothetical protein
MPRAIAADRETAVHIDPLDGSAEVFATADHPTPYAYFMAPDGPPASCERGQPLSSGRISVYRLGPGGRFDLAKWQGAGGIAYELEARGGVLHSSRESNY